MRFLRRRAKQLAFSRHEYKSTWMAVSRTREQATMSVIGCLSEDQLRASAEDTRRVLESTIGIKSDDVVLEIGCGIGRVGEELAPRCKKWIGSDVSANMLKYASQRLARFPNVELIETSGYDLAPIPDNSVDVVYCTVVFMHLDEWDRYNYVLEAYRVLGHGGRFMVDNFNLCSDEGWSVFENHLQEFAGNRPPHISKSSTPQEIETYLTRARFRDVKIQERQTWVIGSGTK